MLKQKHTVLRGIWLNPQRVASCIETFLLQMLEPRLPHTSLRQSWIEELNRKVKRKEVVLEYLGLQEVGIDNAGDVPLHILTSCQEHRLWQDTLLLHEGDCPIGFVFNTYDCGRVVAMHEIFQQLPPGQQELLRTYAALAVRGKHHEGILTWFRRNDAEPDRAAKLMREARRRIQSLDRSVLFSPDGNLRVQLGSISQTTKNILREGLRGDYLFILPQHLFVGRTNYAEVEFIIYLNFFVRHGVRTHLAGTAQQKEALTHLLNLTIFGVFDPQAAVQPSLPELQQAYGVPDAETYAFFRICYELYSVREDEDTGRRGAVLGFETYVDFILLGEVGQPTLISLPPQDQGTTPAHPVTTRVIPQPNGTFDVWITQSDGKFTNKRLVVVSPTRELRPVPEDQCLALQFATERPRFGITPLGTSHGFDPQGDLTCFVIWINGMGILVDPSPEALGYLEHIGVAQTDLLYVMLTHIHADHDGGLIEKLLGRRRTTIIASDVVFQSFLRKAQLVTGYDFAQQGLVEHLAANPGAPIWFEVAGEQVELGTRWNLHPVPTNGFKVCVENTCFGYSGDTQYAPALIRQLQVEQHLTPQHSQNLLYFFWQPDGTPTIDLLYHEAGIPPIHTDRRQLEYIPEAVKTRTALVHIADDDVPLGAQPRKPPLFVTHTLLPPTDQSRRTVLLRTLELVSYLYDVPMTTLEGLLDMAIIRVFPGGERLIHKGPIRRGAALSFFVVVDGKVAVKDGRRLITTLIKADSFGEWSISHQRSFHTADVVTCRRTQLLELDETAYQWMVHRHPIIQERLGRIRALLPRLQLAQDTAIQLTRDDLQRHRSVLEEMSTSQLSAFIVFSEVMKFAQGTPVVVEGDIADGFYILLSGHLAVTVAGTLVGELSEGDVFGEIGLLQEGTRTATVTVVSADAEVLFMSQQNFAALLRSVPAFSFGIRVLAAQRRERKR